MKCVRCHNDRRLSYVSTRIGLLCRDCAAQTIDALLKLNPEYAEMSERRIANTEGAQREMFT